MRVSIPQRNQGNRIDNPNSNDLEQKLTYQQLLNLNHDLSKENKILQNTSTNCFLFQVDGQGNNLGNYIVNFKLNLERKMLNFIMLLGFILLYINFKQLQSHFSKHINLKYKNFNINSRLFMISSSAQRRSFRKFVDRTSS